MENTGLVILLAFILDLILGDPYFLPHPVRWMGKGIEKIEGLLRKTAIPLKLSGILLVISMTGFTFILSLLMLKIAYAINYYFGLMSSVLIIWTAIAPRNLYDESMNIYRALNKGDLESARKGLSMLVGRDTNKLDEKGVIRASVETVAENIVDAVISPLFYALIGGAPLAITYRAINTMDSMVGYKNDRYKDFGWASARVDDAANYIPARISALLIPLSALICGKDCPGSLKIALRDGKKNPSPNSGIPEAAVAGALGIRLGGVNYYSGVPSHKPFIGDGSLELSNNNIKEANCLMLITSVFMVLICYAIVCIISWYD
ncbi:MAG: cobalamin biosynthesis protein CobD [Nitrospinae bacterium]|nr:cobalamin biosynthesis protein CobD [Nitrospinota bacterium]